MGRSRRYNATRKLQWAGGLPKRPFPPLRTLGVGDLYDLEAYAENTGRWTLTDRVGAELERRGARYGTWEEPAPRQTKAAPTGKLHAVVDIPNYSWRVFRGTTLVGSVIKGHTGAYLATGVDYESYGSHTSKKSAVAAFAKRKNGRRRRGRSTRRR